MSSAPKTTVIRNADWIVAWDGEGHSYLQGGDVAFSGDEIVFVGKSYRGGADVTVEGRGRLVVPGFVNVHSHPSSEPGNKGLLEEIGSPALGQSSLYEYMPAFRLGSDGAAAATKAAVVELLLSGVTTLVDLSLDRPGWAEDLASTGIRAVLAPMFRDAAWRTPDGHSVVYDWDEKAGAKAMRQALETIDAAQKHPSGRLSGMVCPAQIDTCTPGLLKDAVAAARERGIVAQLHTAQSIVEFNEITRRHGKTPVEWLDSLGILGPDLVLGHGIFLNDHPFIHWPHADDFSRLRDSGAQVAHCPTVFARRGISLNWLGRYVSAGIAVGIGTDTFPHDFLDEMRLAAYVARVRAGDFRAASTQQVFEAATVGGAKILRRTDLGRLAVGAKADFSLVDLSHPMMRPVRDPLRSLVYAAGSRAVRDVYVAGEQVVREGRVLTIDVEAAHAALAEAQAAALQGVPGRDWAGRTAEQLSPMVYPVR
jgi:cytosine/adenosine deaminase-related metal-dependent hydrolase